MNTRLRKFSSFYSFAAGTICTLITIALLSFDRNKEDSEAFKPVYNIPEIPASISFAGENAPLHRWEVKQYLEKELLYNYYQPGHMLYIMRLSQQYFPIIEERLKYHNVPDDFKYLCVAESNLQNLVSKAGASGFWQFMKTTAPGYNLEVSSAVDERYHVIKSTDAACNYLKTAYKKFGNWTAAAASYNCGMGGYNQRASFQGTYDYYQLQLPEETQRYIFRILAFKHIIQNADSLGFVLPEAHPIPSTRIINVTQTITNLSAFAQSNGTDYKILKMLNPWLRGQSLPVRAGKTYQLVVPQ